MESAAYNEGYNANLVGQLIYACPYEFGTPEEKDWCDGWNDAEDGSDD